MRPEARAVMPAMHDFVPAARDLIPVAHDPLPAVHDFMPAVRDFMPAARDFPRVARRSGPAARGFTLVEAVIAVAIAAALVGALGVFVSNLIDARGRLTRLAQRVECADAAFEAIARAASSAVVSDLRHGAGIVGGPSGVAIVRSAVGLGADGSDLLGERLRVEVRHDAAERRIVVRRGGREDVLDPEVAALRIRYLAEDGWTEAFDSAEAEGFPVGIEVSIWFAGSGSAGPDAIGEVAALEAELDAGPGAAAASPPDRVRFFRIPGAPRVDPLALRAIREEGSGQ